MSNARFSIIQSRAGSDRRLSDPQLRTLVVLGTYGDKNGWCYPSLSTLGDLIGKSRQAVSKDIQALVSLGYVEVTKRYKEDGSKASNLYRLIFDTPVDTLSTPEVDTLSTPEVDTLSTPEVDITSLINEPINELKEYTPQQKMVGALSDVTGLDYRIKSNAGRLAKYAAELIKAGYTPEDITDNYSPGCAWYTLDWRGKRGEKPRPDQIGETIAILKVSRIVSAAEVRRQEEETIEVLRILES